MPKKFFITTAIDYVNAKPHIGHALEKVQADVWARYHRATGDDVLFLSGTDENSLKNVQAAEKAGVPVREFVDRNAQAFKDLKKALNLSFDDFIRTTEERHRKGVEKLWLACEKDIYRKKYKGLYCIGCEEFYTEKELVDGLCPEHKKKPELVEEENYFFRLSNYQKQLKGLIENDKIKIIPETRKNEVLSFIDSGLKDICISRSKERAHGWGIPVPGDESQIIWVWFDALANYITALGYGTGEKKFNDFWQENDNKLHLIGKGILRFHAVYWPGMLLSAGLSVPERIIVHEYITVEGEKMSKSIGNVIDPFELVEKYGTDAVRYFLLREISPFKDGDFSYRRFEERYNADLAKGLGNLLARTISLAEKLDVKAVKAGVPDLIDEPRERYQEAVAAFKFNDALGAVWEIIANFDRCIEQEEPWKNKENSAEVVSNALFALKEIAELLKLFLPETAEKILKQVETRKSEPLFPNL